MTTRRISTLVLLSIVSRRKLCDDFGDIIDALNWLVDDSMDTFQLGMIQAECRPYLLDWFPELDRNYSNITPANFFARKAEIVGDLGLWRDVPQIPKDDHTPNTVDRWLSDFERIVPQDKLILLDLGEDDEDDDNSYGEINWK